MRQFLILYTMFSLGIFSTGTRVSSQEITNEQLEKIRGKKVSAEEVRQANDLLRKWSEYYKSMDRQKFHVKGQVVDDSQQSLDNVTLFVGTYVRGTFFNPEAGKWADRKLLLKDGTFDIRESGITQMTLDFEKAGYYRNSIIVDGNLTEKAKREMMDRIMKGEKVEGPEVSKEGLRVVLEKRGEITHLLKVGGQLQYSTDGRGQIIDFGESDAEINPIFRVVANIANTKQLPQNCVYIIAEKDESGKIAMVSYKPAYSSGSPMLYPKKIRLSINTEKDWGFLTYQPKNMGNPYHEMKTAPIDGYQKEIEIDLSDLSSINQDVERDEKTMRMFYFKIGSKYGKAQLAVFPNEPIAILGGNFRIQPNGSRNLETGE